MADKEQLIEILLVEAKELDARVISESFHEVVSPHNLHVVTDGKQALSFLHRGVEFTDAPRPDLVLLDWNLPKVSCVEVLAAMKEHRYLRDIPVIVMTNGRQDLELLRQTDDLQANSYVRKPHQIADFLDLARAIDHFWLRHAVLPSHHRQSEEK